MNLENLKIDDPLLKKIIEAPGAPGFENRIRGLVEQQMEGFVDTSSKDNMGNLIAIKKGRSSDKRVMVAAHLDEISFIVTHIDENGFIRFHTLGGFDPKTLSSQRVFIHGRKDLVGVMGCMPIHVKKSDGNEKLQCKDFFIDTGLTGKEVKELVRIGDPITRQGDLISLGHCLCAKSLDNRIAVYVLLEALRQLKSEQLPYDLYATFSVQEELGVRGAIPATLAINPDFSLALDLTLAMDVPGGKEEEKCTELGKGTAIKVMDAMSVCDSRMVAYLRKQADSQQIPYQMEVLTAGGTDTSAMQRMSPSASIAGAISIPARYVHQTVETVHREDVLNSIRLLCLALKNLDQLDTQWDDRS